MKMPSLLLYLLSTVVFILPVHTTQGQTVKDIEELYAKRMYEEVISKAKTLMTQTPNNAYLYHITGSVYVKESKFDSSLFYSRKAIELDNDSTWVSGWSHYNLGCAYFGLKDRAGGINEMNRCITLGLTVNNVKSAKGYLDSIGYEVKDRVYEKGYLPDWVTIQGTNITFKFQDTVGITSAVYKFIERHEEAYSNLNKVFEAKLPSKIIYHVWNDADIAKKVMHKQLGFTSPKLCFSHVSRQQTVGHEITHSLSYWAWGTSPLNVSKFISEGIAVSFDLGEYDKYALARRVVDKEGIKDIHEIWKNDKEWDNDVLYPIAGAFVTYVYQNLPPEQFKQLVKTQTYDQVRVLYGQQFDKIMADFSKLIGIKG